MAAMFAPPPQSIAQGNIQLDYSEYQDLMDFEQEQEPASAIVADQADMDVDKAFPWDDESLAPEKVHLRGVDNMKTRDVEAFAREYFEPEMVKVEWIDDTSCNLVYDLPTTALAALEAFSGSAADSPLTLRLAKQALSHPESSLEVRIARADDRKEPGARERSRFYLFHPEEDRFEQKERQRREATRRRDRSYDRTDKDYARRYYDHGEHERRRNRDADQFRTDFYDDDAAARQSRSRRSGSYERDRSTSPRRRNNVELFPERRREPMEVGLSGRRLKENKNKELFPDKLGNGRLRSDRSLSPEKDSLYPPSPQRGTPAATRELELPPKRFEDRITIPKRSLEDRINPDSLSRGDDGFKIRGRGSNRDMGDDLFAEKLRAVKGEGLVFEESGRRRNGRRRNKAEDMFN